MSSYHLWLKHIESGEVVLVLSEEGTSITQEGCSEQGLSEHGWVGTAQSQKGRQRMTNIN